MIIVGILAGLGAGLAFLGLVTFVEQALRVPRPSRDEMQAQAFEYFDASAPAEMPMWDHPPCPGPPECGP